MFDFERLDVYQLVREQNIKVLRYIYKQKEIDDQIIDLWKKASMNIVLYLAEATGKMNNPDKMHFLTNSRTSVFEAVAILEVVRDLGFIEENLYTEFYNGYERASKMLLGMIRSYNK